MKRSRFHCWKTISSACLAATTDINWESRLMKGIEMQDCNFCLRCGICMLHERCQCSRYANGKLKPSSRKMQISDAERQRRSEQMRKNMQKRWHTNADALVHPNEA